MIDVRHARLANMSRTLQVQPTRHNRGLVETTDGHTHSWIVLPTVSAPCMLPQRLRNSLIGEREQNGYRNIFQCCTAASHKRSPGRCMHSSPQAKGFMNTQQQLRVARPGRGPYQAMIALRPTLRAANLAMTVQYLSAVIGSPAPFWPEILWSPLSRCYQV